MVTLKELHDLSLGLADPGATSLTAKNLKIGTYTFTVKALTALGECGTTQLSATLNSLSMLYFTVKLRFPRVIIYYKFDFIFH